MLKKLLNSNWPWVFAGLCLGAFLVGAFSIFTGLTGSIDCQHATEQHRNCTGYNLLFVGLWQITEATNWLSPAITGLATIAVAFFTWTLFRAATEQSLFTKATVDHMRRTERAFVFLEEIEIPIQSVTWTNNRAHFGSMGITPRWRNGGKTPTRNLELQVTMREWDGALPDGHDYFYQDESLRLVMGPNANEWSPQQTFDMFPAQEAAEEEIKTIYIWGEARYTDVFDDTPRYTRFCYRMQVHDMNGNYSPQFLAWGPYNRTDFED